MREAQPAWDKTNQHEQLPRRIKAELDQADNDAMPQTARGGAREEEAEGAASAKVTTSYSFNACAIVSLSDTAREP